MLNEKHRRIDRSFSINQVNRIISKSVFLNPCLILINQGLFYLLTKYHILNESTIRLRINWMVSSYGLDGLNTLNKHNCK